MEHEAIAGVAGTARTTVGNGVTKTAGAGLWAKLNRAYRVVWLFQSGTEVRESHPFFSLRAARRSAGRLHRHLPQCSYRIECVPLFGRRS
jgi:hypothetical protein